MHKCTQIQIHKYKSTLSFPGHDVLFSPDLDNACSYPGGHCNISWRDKIQCSFSTLYGNKYLNNYLNSILITHLVSMRRRWWARIWGPVQASFKKPWATKNWFCKSIFFRLNLNNSPLTWSQNLTRLNISLVPGRQQQHSRGHQEPRTCLHRTPLQTWEKFIWIGHTSDIEKNRYMNRAPLRTWDKTNVWTCCCCFWRTLWPVVVVLQSSLNSLNNRKMTASQFWWWF